MVKITEEERDELAKLDDMTVKIELSMIAMGYALSKYQREQRNAWSRLHKKYGLNGHRLYTLDYPTCEVTMTKYAWEEDNSKDTSR